MNLKAKIGFFKAAIKGLPPTDEIDSTFRYHGDDHYVSVDTDGLNKEHVDAILAHAKKLSSSKEDDVRRDAESIIRKIESFQKLLANPEGEKVGRLERLTTALKAYLERSEHKFVWYEEDDGILSPYYVTKIEFHPPERNERPARCTLSGRAIRHGSSVSLTLNWEQSDLGGKKTAPELLADEGCYRETPELYQQYLKELEIYNAISTHVGAQYSAIGYGLQRYSRKVSMIREGVPARVVIDDDGDDENRRGDDDSGSQKRGSDSVATTGSFWKKGTAKDEDEDSVPLPVQAYVQVFDLGLHEYCLLHATMLSEYAYDSTPTTAHWRTSSCCRN